MQKYLRAGLLGSGTYADVFCAVEIATGKKVAIKCLKETFRSYAEAHSVLEVRALRRVTPHPHIVQLIEVLYDRATGRLAFVFEYLELTLRQAITEGKIASSMVPTYMAQLLLAVEHSHRMGYFHRDIKPENILVSSNLTIVKLADFGCCRKVLDKNPATPYVCTRWYRAPECIFTNGMYTSQMDVWSLGCVFFELIARYPLFAGTSEIDQVQRIRAALGSPPPNQKKKMKLDMVKQYEALVVASGFGDDDDEEAIWGEAPKNSFFVANPHPPMMSGTNAGGNQSGGSSSQPVLPMFFPPDMNVDPAAVDLLRKLLRYDPKKRLTATTALQHPFVQRAWDGPSELRGANGAAGGAHRNVMLPQTPSPPPVPLPTRRSDSASTGHGQGCGRRGKSKEKYHQSGREARRKGALQQPTCGRGGVGGGGRWNSSGPTHQSRARTTSR